MIARRIHGKSRFGGSICFTLLFQCDLLLLFALVERGKTRITFRELESSDCGYPSDNIFHAHALNRGRLDLVLKAGPVMVSPISHAALLLIECPLPSSNVPPTFTVLEGADGCTMNARPCNPLRHTLSVIVLRPVSVLQWFQLAEPLARAAPSLCFREVHRPFLSDPVSTSHC